MCRRWHELCLVDPDAAHPFDHGIHPRHDERLAAYLAEALGGPHGAQVDLDERCLALFDQALADAAVPSTLTPQLPAVTLR